MYDSKGLEDLKTAIDNERSRLQSQLRDMERDAMQLQQQLRATQDELQKSQAANAQGQNEERELQARLSNETEERERLQLQLHQLKKQVNVIIILFANNHLRTVGSKKAIFFDRSSIWTTVLK